MLYVSVCLLAVPVLLHRKDAEKIAPLWLKWTELIRNDTEDGDLKWDPEWKKVILLLFLLFIKSFHQT